MDPDAPPPEEVSAELFDFLSVLLRDLERGEVRDLEEYESRFPGCGEALRREYEARTGGAASAAHPELREIGPYRLLHELGRGGQGVVYLAEDTRIERRVALKLLPASSLLFSEAKRGRLRREAEVVSRLDHPGICGLYDAEIRGDFAYIAMPVLEGVTLAAAIAEARAEPTALRSGPLPLAPCTREELQRLLAFFEECARALHAAHEAGVVHRDVKPGNLMVTPGGRGVWLDFGQALDTESASRALTMSGEVFGTPAYMSPEQVAGEAQRVDARTDVWALGVSLFEALTLERPFRGASTHSLLSAVQEQPPPSACALRPSLPRDVDVVLRTALEKDLTRRYSSALELAEELARIRRSEPILARPAGPALRLRRWARRSPLLFTTVSGALVALTLALVWTLYLLAREERALDYALGRHLGERAIALLEEDPSASLVLGIEAVERGPSYLTRSALYAALERCHLARELDGSPARRFRDIAMMDDGRHVAAALSDGTGRLYDIESGAEVLRWQAHEGDAVAIGASGAWVATVGLDRAALVYDTDSREEIARIAGLELEADALQLVDPPDEILASYLTVFGGGSEMTFGIPSGDAMDLGLPGLPHQAAPSTSAPPGFDFGEPVVHASLSPDRTRLAAALQSGVVQVFDLSSGRRLSRLEGYLNPVKVLWSPDGEYLVTHSKGPTARVWFAENRPDVYRLHCGPAPVEHVAFSKDGERALTVSADGSARLWMTPAAPRSGSEVGRLLSRFDPRERVRWPVDFDEFAEQLGVDLEPRGRLAGCVQAVRLHRASPSGEHLATLQEDGEVRLWTHPGGDLLWSRRFARGDSEAAGVDLCFHPGGAELAVACDDNRVRILDARTGEDSREGLRTIPPRDVQWSPDGQRLLVTGAQGRAAFHVEQLETGERMRTEVFHHGDITSGAFSPDGALVLTSSRDGTIFVRDVRDGSPVVHLHGDGAPVLQAAFSSGPGPLRVIGGFADGSARVWPVDPLPGAKARKPRELSEWEVAREERLALPLEFR